MEKLTEDGKTFFVRDELLDLEEDLQIALGDLEEIVGQDPAAGQVLDRIYDVARRLKQAAGLSPAQPPPLVR